VTHSNTEIGGFTNNPLPWMAWALSTNGTRDGEFRKQERGMSLELVWGEMSQNTRLTNS